MSKTFRNERLGWKMHSLLFFYLDIQILSREKFPTFMDLICDQWNIGVAQNLFFSRNNILTVMPGDGKSYVLISAENICIG